MRVYCTYLFHSSLPTSHMKFFSLHFLYLLLTLQQRGEENSSPVSILFLQSQTSVSCIHLCFTSCLRFITMILLLSLYLLILSFLQSCFPFLSMFITHFHSLPSFNSFPLPLSFFNLNYFFIFLIFLQ